MRRIFENVSQHRDTKHDIQYFKRSHWFRRWKWGVSIACVAAAALWVLSYLIAGGSGLFNPGPLSNSHALFERNCLLCHGGEGGEGGAGKRGFLRPVSDATCEKCHSGSVHHSNQIFQQKESGQPRCASCHLEHRGRNVSPKMVQDADCVQCHGSLTFTPSAKGIPSRPENGYTRSIHDFGTDHPEFRPIREKSTDSAKIKLNHQKHLQPDLLGPLGKRVQMKCADCHHMDSGGRYMMPVDYSRDCSSCHMLEFDERFKASAPHGDAAVARTYIRWSFAKLFDGNTHDLDFPIRPDRELKLETLKQLLQQAPLNLPPSAQKQADKAADWLFMRRCQLCHIEDTGAKVRDVLKPDIPSRWFVHSEFSHNSHRMLQCIGCHAAAPKSTATSDVLLPRRADCLECHKGSRGAPASCAICHVYHSEKRPL